MNFGRIKEQYFEVVEVDVFTAFFFISFFFIFTPEFDSAAQKIRRKKIAKFSDAKNIIFLKGLNSCGKSMKTFSRKKNDNYYLNTFRVDHPPTFS